MFLTNKLNFQILGVIQLYCEFSESYQKVTRHAQLVNVKKSNLLMT